MLYIRTDMNDTIATGHVMRCLAIAEAAKKQGEDTTFLLADNQAAEILEQRGYEFLILNTDWTDMDSELPILSEIITEKKISSILIDSYQVTKYYLEHLTQMVRTVYLDDSNAFLYPVDALICYACYWEKFQLKERYPDKNLLLGPMYVPLRKEFGNCCKKKIKPTVEELLLLSGGTDNYGILDTILDRIDKTQYQRIEVICGKYYSNYGYLCEKYKENKNVHIHAAVTDMKSYMDSADLAITAGGVTLYELCAVGTPAISYSIADNQLENVRKFQKDGIIEYAGDVRWDDVVGNINGYLQKYYAAESVRQEKSEKMQELVDGKGAERIARILKEL